MKAYIHHGMAGPKGGKYTEFPTQSVGEGEVRVRLRTAGLNRRDLRVMNLAKESDAPFVLGSDGAGIVEEIGSGVTTISVGEEVIIHPGLRWVHNSPAPPANYEILGSPSNGTFAEEIVISTDHVARKPRSLTWDEAGVLAVAGVTAYRALFTRGNLDEGQTVLIPGIGGGVAIYLLQFAKAAGARVIVTSRSEEKRAKALALGADVALDTSPSWLDQLDGNRVDLVIDSIGGATVERALEVLKPGGTLVSFGATTEDHVQIDIRSFFYGQYNLLGTTLGSMEELHEMVKFVEQHQIRPVIDRIYPLHEAAEALLRLQRSENFGKIGLRID